VGRVRPCQFRHPPHDNSEAFLTRARCPGTGSPPKDIVNSDSTGKPVRYEKRTIAESGSFTRVCGLGRCHGGVQAHAEDTLESVIDTMATTLRACDHSGRLYRDQVPVGDQSPKIWRSQPDYVSHMEQGRISRKCLAEQGSADARPRFLHQQAATSLRSCEVGLLYRAMPHDDAGEALGGTIK